MMSGSKVTTNSATTPVLEIKGINSKELPNVGFPKRPGRYYVKLTLGTDVRETALSVRGNAIVWDENFYFDADSSLTLDLQVYAHRSIRHDAHIGGIFERVDKLLEQGATETVTRKLSKRDKHGTLRELQHVIEFSASLITTPASATAQDVLEQAEDALAQMGSSPLSVGPLNSAIDEITSVTENVVSFANAWDPLLKKIELFTKIVDRIAEVHPYAKMAWTVLSAAHKVVLAQVARDHNVTHLVQTMADVYSFMDEAEPLKEFETQRRILVQMVQQTLECGYFIRDYARNKNFGKRFLENVISDVDVTIKRYETKFGELKSAFQERAVLRTEITVLRVLDQAEDIATEIKLDDIAYAEGARYNPERQCLPGTREEVVREITDWINGTDDLVPRMFVLSGVAGSGESSIAHTIARMFDDLERLGSSFCFDRANQAKLGLDMFFSTIARDLADRDPQRKQSLWRIVKEKTALRKTRAAREQFEHFILKPAADLTTVGPIVIVIDAFDESGDEASRRVILSILAERISELPPNLRVLVTTRREADIEKAFESNPHVYCKLMDSIDLDSTNNDIRAFIRDSLADVASLDEKWPNQSWCELLVQKSEGLFQWASTACRFIKGEGEHGVYPIERLADILAFSPNINRLDHLYLDILTRLFPADNDVIGLNRFKLVVGRALAAIEPLSVPSLRELCKGDDSVHVVELIMRPMGSLFNGVNEPRALIRPLHTSLRDFLTDPGRSGRFHIDISLHERALALACLRVMEAGLKFNICQLETSYLPNSDVPDLTLRIEEHIPTHLSYSCRFWTRHLQNVACNAETLPAVKDFLLDRTLYWLEVMSFVKEMSAALKSLLFLAEWSRTAKEDIEIFAADATKFVIAFASVISHSTPHIYLSALPFAPASSKVRQTFLPRFRHILSVEQGLAAGWPQIQSVLAGHSKLVTSVAFSPDGKQVVSGSFDKTIQVWDAETGVIVSGPFEGHSESVTSVAFSPDGKQVVSGSGDDEICVQDAQIDFSDCEVSESPFVSYDSARSQVAVQNGFRDDSVLRPDGWVVNSSSTLLFWVPPWNRNGLWWPRNTVVIGRESTKLNFSSFVHGTSWAQYIQDK